MSVALNDPNPAPAPQPGPVLEPAPTPTPAPVAAPAPVDPNAPKPATIFEAAKTPAEIAAAKAVTDAALIGKLVYADKPAWLAEKFWDAKTGEVKVQDLAANEAHLRGLVSKADHKPPATADGYKPEFAPEEAAVKTAYDEMVAQKDPLLMKVMEDAHKAGVSNHDFGIMAKSYLTQALADMPPPIDPAKELAKLGKSGPALVRYVSEMADTLVKHGQFTDADREAFLEEHCTAESIGRLDKLMQYLGRSPIEAIAAVHAQGSVSAAQVRQKQNDLMAKRAKGEHVSEAEWEAVQAEYAKVFGNDPAGRSVAMG